MAGHLDKVPNEGCWLELIVTLTGISHDGFLQLCDLDGQIQSRSASLRGQAESGSFPCPGNPDQIAIPNQPFSFSLTRVPNKCTVLHRQQNPDLGTLDAVLRTSGTYLNCKFSSRQ